MVRAVRGFLGLAKYYRKFIRGFGTITAPLTQLLKHEAFHWTSKAQDAFTVLKMALTQAPILQLPDFSKEFIVTCDSSGHGFGTVLHQGTGSLAYLSPTVRSVTR